MIHSEQPRVEAKHSIPCLANEDVCGPAIVHLLQRAFRVYGDHRYERLSKLSVPSRPDSEAHPELKRQRRPEIHQSRYRVSGPVTEQASAVLSIKKRLLAQVIRAQETM